MNLDDFNAVASQLDPLKEFLGEAGTPFVCLLIAEPTGDGMGLRALFAPDPDQYTARRIARAMGLKYFGERGKKP
jgi:hypothetical protein